MIASVIQPGLMLTMHAIGSQLAAMPRDLYYLRLIHDQTHRPFPAERVWTADCSITSRIWDIGLDQGN
jgi:hypothetical protein